MGMSNETRRVLLVGSLPYDDEATAMSRVHELAGDRLIALPDGEIGERSDQYPNGDRSQWVAGLGGRLTRESALFDVIDAGTMNEHGFPVDFDSTIRLRPKANVTELGQRLSLGYDTFARRSWPHFARLKSSTQHDLRMQVGLPTGLGVAASVLSPTRALRFAPAFAVCVAREAQNTVSAIGAENLLFQVEAPAEVVMAHRTPRLAWRLAQGPVIDLLRQLPDQVPIGLHLCYGDLNNNAAITPQGFERLIGFAQALLRRWPQSHTLAYIHLPFAAGSSPSPTDAAAYRALSRLELPAGARLVAGFVHERSTLAGLETLLATIEAMRGARVDVATACGLGRRSPEIADELIRRCVHLATVA